METVLVTGGAGFIGSHVAEHLVKLGKVRVVVLDDLSGGKIENVPKEVSEFVKGSVTDTSLLYRLFNQVKFSYVYHLAAYAAEALSHQLRVFNYTNNIVGSANLINESIRHKVKCFVYASSIAVYGYGKVPNHEYDYPVPIDPYGIGKLAVERDLAAAGRVFGLRSIIFRPHNVYGERQNLCDSTRNVVGVFMNRILHGLPLEIFGDGEHQRAFTYVTDVAKPIAESPWVPAAYDRTINIGSDVVCTINYLSEQVRDVMGVPDHPVKGLPERDEARIAASSHKVFRNIFGAQPSTPLEVGLAKMAAWAKSVGSQPMNSPERLEIER